MRGGFLYGAAFPGLMLAATPAISAETITYSYDALGRVVQVLSTGTVNNNQSTTIAYDAATNRTNYTISTASVVSIAAASVTEGGNLVFTVTRTGSTTGAATVNYATANGSAISPGDYTAASGTLTFAAGETSKTITVATIDDTSVEAAETMTINLSSPSGATLGTSSATGTINDNDTAATLAISNASITEGGTLVFTVTRSGTTSTAVSASYNTAGGTATSGSDFTAASGTVSFAAGQTSQTISVATIDDALSESSETLTVTLSSPTGGATITTTTGTGTINDNDSPAVISIGNAASAVTEGGTLQFTATRTGNTSTTVTAQVSTVNGTAVAPGDFNAISLGTISFSPGQTTQLINVVTLDDSTVESTETMSLSLSNPTGGATLGTSSGTGNINDNDTAGGTVYVTISDASASEGDFMFFTLTRTGDLSLSSSISYATSAGGTATLGTDLSNYAGTKSFSAGEATKTISISSNEDTTVEPDETFNVTISSSSSGTVITDNTGVGTILNDD